MRNYSLRVGSCIEKQGRCSGLRRKYSSLKKNNTVLVLLIFLQQKIKLDKWLMSSLCLEWRQKIPDRDGQALQQQNTHISQAVLILCIEASSFFCIAVPLPHKKKTNALQFS
jgi:hypothetical protein